MDLFQIVRTEESRNIISKSANWDITILNEAGESLLHEAISYKKWDYAFWLIERGIDLNVQNHKGMSVLHLLPFHPNVAIATALILRKPDITLKDSFGNTPLWYAVFNSRRDYDLIKIYLKLEPDIESKNKAGRSPIDFAKQIEDKELLKLLLKK